MNRYVAEGVMADLCQGKNVLVLCADRSHVDDVQRDILATVDNLDLPGLKVRRAHGCESISYDGASVRFSSYHSSLRGLSPDVIVLDGPPYNLSSDWWYEFDHTLAVRAEVIRP